MVSRIEVLIVACAFLILTGLEIDNLYVSIVSWVYAIVYVIMVITEREYVGRKRT